MSAGPVIVGEVADQDAAHVSFAEDENVIRTLAPDRADQTPHKGLVGAIFLMRPAVSALSIGARRLR